MRAKGVFVLMYRVEERVIFAFTTYSTGYKVILPMVFIIEQYAKRGLVRCFESEGAKICSILFDPTAGTK